MIGKVEDSNLEFWDGNDSPYKLEVGGKPVESIMHVLAEEMEKEGLKAEDFSINMWIDDITGTYITVSETNSYEAMALNLNHPVPYLRPAISYPSCPITTISTTLEEIKDFVVEVKNKFKGE